MLKNLGRLALGIAGVTAQIIGLFILAQVHKNNVCVREKQTKTRKK